MMYYDKDGIMLNIGDRVMDYIGNIGEFECIDGEFVIRFGGSKDYGKLVPGNNSYISKI